MDDLPAPGVNLWDYFRASERPFYSVYLWTTRISRIRLSIAETAIGLSKERWFSEFKLILRYYFLIVPTIRLTIPKRSGIVIPKSSVW